MTAEKLHDAIGLLSADLIAEADRIRCAKSGVIPWKRYAALAACFVLVLGSAWFTSRLFAPKGAAESAPQEPAAAAPMEAARDEAAAEEANTSITGSVTQDQAPCAAEPEDYALYDVQCFTAPYPQGLCMDAVQTAIFRSAGALAEHIRTAPEMEYPEDALKIYDDDWFATHDLLLVRAIADPSEYRYTVERLTQPDNDWVLTLRRETGPEDNSLEPRLWHMFAGVDKDLIDDPAQVLIETEVLP